MNCLSKKASYSCVKELYGSTACNSLIKKEKLDALFKAICLEIAKRIIDVIIKKC